ncbi:Uncharacterised protein [Vibrio cholerae]|uniref:Uncharacterized protein n=1 Tax=Vibrio cholerae TaxID=666 RepID=A0A655UNG5_VIBCL|nr:Uncharacterised protein [Vibrio cholerae]
MGVNAGFGNNDGALWNERCQLLGAIQVGGQITQIAVIDADHFRLQSNRALQFLLVADFGEYAHTKVVRHSGQFTILIIVEHRQHQQNRIGLIMARQINLIRVDHKIFAQHRLSHLSAHLWQKFKTTLEILFIGQYRNGIGVLAIHGGDVIEIKRFADKPLRR